MSSPAATPPPRDGARPRIRPVRPEDAAALRRFYEGLSDESLRLRFHRDAPRVGEGLVRFYAEVDHVQHEGLVAEADGEIVGDARYVAHPAGTGAEFGIVVADGWRRSGLARRLMQALVEAARSRGFRTLEGLVLRENGPMLGFVARFGFEVHVVPQDARSVRVVKRL